MPLNIFIIGPHCAGKTTLLLQLEAYMSSERGVTPTQPAIIHEVVRTIMKEKHFSADDFGTERWIRLQQSTLDAQIEAEERLGAQWFIADRSVIDPVVYAELQPGFGSKLIKSKGWEASIGRMKAGLVIVCEAGQKAWLSSDSTRIALADDGSWVGLNGQFISMLQKEGIPFHLLSKDVVSAQKRMEFVLLKHSMR